MSFTIDFRDLIIVAIVGIANSWFINFIQNKQPFPTGILDFAIRKDKNFKMNKYYIFFIIPFLTGIVLGLLSIAPFLSGFSSALGMFMCVVTAFTNPKMLAPPLQEKLPKARITYTLLILIYFSASLVGNILVAILPYIEYIKSDSYRMGLLTNLTTFVIGSVFTLVLNIILKQNVKEFELSDEMFEKMLYEQENRLTQNVRYIIGEELNDSLRQIADKISSSLDNSNFEKIREIVKGEVANNFVEIGEIMNLAIEQEIIRRSRESTKNKKWNSYIRSGNFDNSGYNQENYPLRSYNKRNYIQKSYIPNRRAEYINEVAGYDYYGERTIKRVYPRYFN